VCRFFAFADVMAITKRSIAFASSGEIPAMSIASDQRQGRGHPE
jgi:hypothetical protein